MVIFFRCTVVYFVIVYWTAKLIRDDNAGVSAQLFRRSVATVNDFGVLLPIFVVLAVLSFLAQLPRNVAIKRILLLVPALAFCLLFLASFSSLKSTLPFFADLLGLPHFFADPMLASLDRWMHFGVDPWRITHAVSEALGPLFSPRIAVFFYFQIWAVLAFYFPILILLLGDRQEILNRYILIYLFCWVVLGGFVAFAFLSAGPVFYDRIFATNQFAELTQVIESSGISESVIGKVQSGLWVRYVEESQAAGSGISAFPSVHVATATMVALYFSEKSRFLAPLGWTFLGVIFFVSVWVGYHYAIDGYFSILVVLAVNKWLKSPSMRFLVDPEPKTQGSD